MWCTCSTVLRRRLIRAADPPTNGRGANRVFAPRPRRRVAISHVSVAGLDETAPLLAGRGVDAQRAELDASNAGRAAAVIAERFGVVHQLYNNARIALSRSAPETEYADYERLSAVNLSGEIHSTKVRSRRGG